MPDEFAEAREDVHELVLRALEAASVLPEADGTWLGALAVVTTCAIEATEDDITVGLHDGHEMRKQRVTEALR